MEYQQDFIRRKKRCDTCNTKFTGENDKVVVELKSTKTLKIVCTQCYVEFLEWRIVIVVMLSIVGKVSFAVINAHYTLRK